MKKFLLISTFLIFILLISIAGCGKKEVAPNQNTGTQSSSAGATPLDDDVTGFSVTLDDSTQESELDSLDSDLAAIESL